MQYSRHLSEPLPRKDMFRKVYNFRRNSSRDYMCIYFAHRKTSGPLATTLRVTRKFRGTAVPRGFDGQRFFAKYPKRYAPLHNCPTGVPANGHSHASRGHIRALGNAGTSICTSCGRYTNETVDNDNGRHYCEFAEYRTV